MDSSSIVPHDASASSLAPFFEARSLAIIGASTDPLKQGGRPVRYAQLAQYPGQVYPINPNAAVVQGLPAYPSLSAVPGPVECAFIALPAPAVEAAVRECADKGVRAAVVISAGFAEIGRDGRAAQERLAGIARAAGMRLIGPNCMGVMDVGRRLFATFLSAFGEDGVTVPQPGALSLVSQSGAFGAHVHELVRAEGAGFAKWVTTGNQADVDVADCVAYLATDAATKVIMVYMEGCRDGAKLREALARARAARKPVIVLKSGRSEVGGAAARSHTGSLAGADRAFDGLIAQMGVHRAATIGELVDVSVACLGGRFPAKPEVGLVTISGGVGALMADYAEELGLGVPPLPATAQAKLRTLMPFGASRNPVDPTAQWSQDMSLVRAGLETLVEDGGHDAVVIFASTIGRMPLQQQRLREQILPIRARHPDKTLVLSIVGSPELIQGWRDEGFLVYPDPRRALEVVAALAKLSGTVRGTATASRLPRARKRANVAPGRATTEVEAMALLGAAGIPFVPHRLATSRAAAERAAAEVGFPAVLKVVSPDIAHKSEIGGVALGLETRRAVGQAYTTVLARARKAARGARLDGALVARQIAGGVETILGVSRDASLGPVVMFGIGGIFVEVYKDVSVRVAPFAVAEARAMIREVKGYPLLAGARGRPPCDVEALARALSRLSLFAAANAETVESIDINPFIVLPKGKGAVGVDALIVASKK